MAHGIAAREISRQSHEGRIMVPNGALQRRCTRKSTIIEALDVELVMWQLWEAYFSKYCWVSHLFLPYLCLSIGPYMPYRALQGPIIGPFRALGLIGVYRIYGPHRAL